MKERYKIALTLLISILIVFLVLSCATPKGIERRAEVSQARHERQEAKQIAALKRITADTLSTQRSRVDYGTGYNNLFYWNNWNNGFYNRPFFNPYRPVYTIPIRFKRTKHRNNRNNGNNTTNINTHRSNNRVRTTVPVRRIQVPKKRVLRKVQVRPVRKIKQ